jgi:uncharacterized protein YndB with AHSA1/START domain
MATSATASRTTDITPGGSATATEPAEREVLITRLFDAPRELVFRAWTDPEHLARWYAPRGCTTRFRELDLRQGGAFHSCVRTPDGHDCWAIGVYREIAPPERLVFTLVVADEHGNAVVPGDSGKDSDWPAETVVTVTFVEEGGRTRLTLHQTVSEALAIRTGAHPSWIEMLDRLAEELAPA